MDLVMNQVVDFVLNKSSIGDQQSEVSLTETCLSYLSSLIDVSMCRTSPLPEILPQFSSRRLLLRSP